MFGFKSDQRRKTVEAAAKDILAWSRVISMRRQAEGPRPLAIIKRKPGRRVVVIKLR
jgi:hypothetical protein